MALQLLVRDETKRIAALQVVRMSRVAVRAANKLGLYGFVGVTFVNDLRMKEFGHGATDVLAYPYHVHGPEIGDIFINTDYLARTRHRRNQDSRAEELLVHALIHLKEYTHDNFEDYQKMRKIEEEILGRPCLPSWPKSEPKL